MASIGRSGLPGVVNAVDVLERNVRLRPGALALLSPYRDMTFEEVGHEVNRVGNALLRRGVRFGDHVAILCLDGFEWVACYFAAMKIGAIACSLNTMATGEEHEFALRDCRARVLIADHSLVDSVLERRQDLPFLEHIIVVGGDVNQYQDWVAKESTELSAAATHRDDLCCLNYSSGSSGSPKGIHHAHADLLLAAQSVGVDTFKLTAQDRTYAVARLFFTYGTGGNLIFPWSVGASIVLNPELPRKPRNVLDAIEKYQPTVFFGVPTSYASMLALEDFPEDASLRSLRLCISAGEALPAALWQQWKDATALEILDGIGSTENFHMFIANREGDVRPGSSGRPIVGYEVKIIDEAGATITEPNVVGDLLVRGETAALSYLNRYTESRRTFLGEWLRTGDKYYVDADGYYWHAGRSDDMLKVGGIWVSPIEVESTLMRHFAVAQCAVVGQADSANLIKPRAFVVLKRGVDPSKSLADELIHFCSSHLAAYKRPRWVDFVPALPKTATGKVQRFRLRA